MLMVSIACVVLNLITAYFLSVSTCKAWDGIGKGLRTVSLSVIALNVASFLLNLFVVIDKI